MKIKRYFAADMRQAIRQVRDEQGPDAVILSNRKVDGGVEVVAALDYDEGLVNARLQPEGGESVAATESAEESTDSGQAADKPATQSPGGADRAIYWAQDPSIVAMREELREMRGMLENQLAHLAWSDYGRRNPNDMELLKRLNALGLDATQCDHLVQQAAPSDDVEQAWQRCLGLFARQLPVSDDDILGQGGVVAVVGPTGVGKTTTIAKLAARYALRYGPRQVALISTDSYRIGAHEQLFTYGRILGVPVQVAANAQELQGALASLADKQLVLIDTAGMSQRDVRLCEQFTTLTANGGALRTYLALSSTAQSAVVDEAIRAFSGVTLSGCILTKVDEAAALGGALSVISKYRLPLAYIGDGQRVPEDIHPARAHNLVHRAVELMNEHEKLPRDGLLAEQFGRLVADAHV